MARIALFGGSFNPPHVAHQLACLYVLETAVYDQLWMIPTARHPFAKALAPFPGRLETAHRALDPWRCSPDEFQDEPLGTAGIEADDYVQDSGRQG